MKKIALSLFTLFLFTVAAHADNLYFYGGDWEPNDPNADGLDNTTNALLGGDPYGSAIYQNFVAGAPINVTGLFTNNAIDYIPASGYWEIRAGVSEGNGGTLIASGSGSITNNPTGRSGFGFDEYTNAVSGLKISLNAGTYWFAVVPVCTTCEGHSYNTNSLHAVNAVGTQISDQVYWNSSSDGKNFWNADQYGAFPSMSSGVYADVTPEPSSMTMLGTGLIGCLSALRRKVM
jgi:hypothetical protein